MKRVKFTLSIGFANARHTAYEEFEDDITDQEIEEIYQQWVQSYLDGGWSVEGDE